MPSAKVLIAEIDRSSYVPESNGVYGYMSIPLVRGRTDVAGFSTSEEQFLKSTTPEGRIEPGMDLGYYVALDFLRRSNKLYWGRAHNDARFGGIIFPAEGTAAVPVSLALGLSDPQEYLFKDNELFLLHPTSSGNWSKYLGVTITPNVRELNAFNVNVYWKGVLKETFPVSRSPSAKDGSGQSLYIETVLDASEYINCVDNTMIDSSILPKMLGTLTTKWSDVATSVPYVPAHDAVAKQQQYVLEGANVLAGGFPASVAGAAFVIPKDADAVGAATATISGDFSANPDVDAASSNSSTSVIDFKVTAGDVSNVLKFLPRDGVVTPAIPEVVGSPATPGTKAEATVTFTGPQYSNGTVTFNVGGRAYQIPVVQADSATSIASKLVTAVANDTSALVSASASAGVVTYTAQNAGAGGNSLNNTATHQISGLEVTPVQFAGGENSKAALGTLTFTGTATASGPMSVQVGTQTYLLNVSSGNSAASLATLLANSINSDGAAQAIASVSGAVVSMTAKSVGLGGNSLNLAVTGTVAGISNNVVGFSGGAAATYASGNVTMSDPTVTSTTWNLTLGSRSYAVTGAPGDTGTSLAEKLVASISADNASEVTSASDENSVVISHKTLGTIGNALSITSTGAIGGAQITRSNSFSGGTNPAGAVPASPYVPAVTKDLIVVRDFKVKTPYNAELSQQKVVSFMVGANNTGSDQILIVEGHAVLIKADDDTGAKTAARILADFNSIQNGQNAFQSANSVGDVIEVTYKLQAGNFRMPRVVNSAGLVMDRAYVSQSYQAVIPGIQQIEELTVTGAPTANGSILVSGVAVPVTNTDSRSLVASKIAAEVNSDARFSAVSNGEKVVITYEAAGPQTALSFSAAGTGAGLANLTQLTGVAQIDAISKKSRLKIGGGNNYGVDVTVIIEDVVINIGTGLTTATQVASAIAAADWSVVADVKSVVSTGSEVEIEWKASSGDHAAPAVWAGFTQFKTASPSTTRAYSAASEAVPEVQQLRITAGNTSGRSELLYVGGVPVNLTSLDTSEKSVAARIVSSGLVEAIPALATASLLPTDDRVIQFTYKVTAGNVDPIAVESAEKAPVAVGGGSNGGTVTDTHMIASLKLQQPLTYNLLMDGGWTTPAYQKEMAEVSVKRMDSLSILSVPYSAENSANYMNDIIDYRVNKLNLDTSYAALFTGHLQITDKFNDRKLWIPPTGAVGAIASNTITNYEPWYPFAGDTRGAISWPTDVRRHFEEGEMDLLQDNGINPVLFDPGRGIKLWGQRTLQARPSATDRINVRLLLIYVEVAMKEYLRTFIWEFNDEDTRARCVAGADDFMESVKSRKGLYAFRNVCDSSNNTPADIDNYKLNFNQLMEPAKGIEFVQYYPTIVRTGTIQ